MSSYGGKKKPAHTVNFPDPILLYLIDKFNIVPGRNAFQKLVYFFNLDIGKYKFKWNRFGPFSEELSYILDDLIFENYIHIMSESLPPKVERQYNLCLSGTGKQYLAAINIDRKTQSIINSAIELLNKKNPDEMELLASVHYILSWAKLTKRKLSAYAICKSISDLKRTPAFSVEEVTSAIRDLKKHGLI